MAIRKPTYVLTTIRTGTGDNGTTFFRGDPMYPKHHLNIEYLGALDNIQSKASYAEVIQDVVFALGAHHYSPESSEYSKWLYEKNDSMIETIAQLSAMTPPLEGFVRTTKNNQPLMELRVAIRQAELLACKLKHEYGDPHIDLHIKTLNMMSDFMFLYMLQLFPPTNTWNGINT